MQANSMAFVAGKRQGLAEGRNVITTACSLPVETVASFVYDPACFLPRADTSLWRGLALQAAFAICSGRRAAAIRLADAMPGESEGVAITERVVQNHRAAPLMRTPAAITVCL